MSFLIYPTPCIKQSIKIPREGIIRPHDMNHVQLVRLGNYICLNDGDGKIETDSIAFSHYPATTITPVDFINDGLIDPAVPHRDNGQRHPGSLDGRTRSRQIPAIEAKMYQEKDHEAEKSLKDLLSLEGFS